MSRSSLPLLAVSLSLAAGACSGGQKKVPVAVHEFALQTKAKPAQVAEKTADPQARTTAQELGKGLAGLTEKQPKEQSDLLVDAQTQLGDILKKQPCTVDFLRFQWELAKAIARNLDPQSMKVDPNAQGDEAMSQLMNAMNAMKGMMGPMLMVEETSQLLQVQLAAATDISTFDNHHSRLAAWQLIKDMRAWSSGTFTDEGPFLKLKENLTKEEDAQVKALAQEIVAGLPAEPRNKK